MQSFLEAYKSDLCVTLITSWDRLAHCYGIFANDGTKSMTGIEDVFWNYIPQMQKSEEMWNKRCYMFYWLQQRKSFYSMMPYPIIRLYYLYENLVPTDLGNISTFRFCLPQEKWHTKEITSVVFLCIHSCVCVCTCIYVYMCKYIHISLRHKMSLR